MQQSRTDCWSDPWRMKDAQQGKHDHRSERRQRCAPRPSGGEIELSMRRYREGSRLTDAMARTIQLVQERFVKITEWQHSDPATRLATTRTTAFLGYLFAPGGHRRRCSGTIASSCNPRKLSCLTQ